MKITKQKLVEIIKEELEAALEEGDETDFDKRYAKALDVAYKEINALLPDGEEPDSDAVEERANELLKPSKGGLGPEHDDGGLPF
tara:strand:- start:8 stop:262 length:255 start_codon:yes stop_codon:yes gene_type:complete